MSPDFEKPLRALARKHEVIVLHISDPLDRSLPNLPSLSIEDLETGTISRLTRSQVKNLGERSEKRINDLRTLCRKAGIDFVPLDTGADYLPEIIRLFDQRMSRR